MAVGTGTASMGDIRTEWGRSGAISMSEMYRGGSHVLSKASDNTGTNEAAGVPTSGVISIDDFRGTAKGFTFTYTSGATDQNASTIFGDDFDVNYPKNIVINSGVELGATSTSEEALEVPSGGAGTITITNNGTLSGAGGAVGADGGDAFEAATTCIFINNGTVRAGGGGGGAGGTGGGGRYTSTQTRSGPNQYMSGNCSTPCISAYGSGWYCAGGCQCLASGCDPYYCGTCGRNTTHNTSGGSGGSGAIGAGYNQSAGAGSSGSNGGTNAGAGGAGGSGGAFGANGSAGATGVNGNRTNGSAGGASGAAGKYLRGSSFVTFTNNGTALGGTA